MWSVCPFLILTDTINSIYIKVLDRVLDNIMTLVVLPPNLGLDNNLDQARRHLWSRCVLCELVGKGTSSCCDQFSLPCVCSSRHIANLTMVTIMAAHSASPLQTIVMSRGHMLSLLTGVRLEDCLWESRDKDYARHRGSRGQAPNNSVEGKPFRVMLRNQITLLK